MVERVLVAAARSAVHYLPYMAVGVVIAGLTDALVPGSSLRTTFRRAGFAPVLAATAVGVLTPLCSCGSVAILIPALSAGVPWAPVMAFLVSSPLMSPSAFVLLSGVLGMRMAVAKLATATGLGLFAGWLTGKLEAAGFLAGQFRGRPRVSVGDEAGAACQASACRSQQRREVSRIGVVARAIGVQAAFIGKYFLLFLVVGSAIRELVPQEWVMSVVGAGRVHSVPVAGLVGVPLYLTGAGAVPLVSSLLSLGMSRGAALAFLITGSGTSLPALGAVAAIARGRILFLYVSLLLVGAIVAGYVFGGWI